MPEPSTKGKFPLTICMDADLAKRLAVAAEAQKRPAEDLVIDMLDRSLPRLQSSGQGKIPTRSPYNKKACCPPFKLCPACLEKYRSLRFDAACEYQLNVMPLASRRGRRAS